ETVDGAALGRAGWRCDGSVVAAPARRSGRQGDACRRKSREAVMKLAMFAALAMLGLGSLPVWGEPLLRQEAKPYGADLLARVRVAATVIPGALPSRINYIKLAESHRPLADIIDGGSKDDYISARTAFQVVYLTGTVMIDSGMDQAVHRFFGFG